MSLQLVCINYGNFEDAIKAVNHCNLVFNEFEKTTVLHPDPFKLMNPGASVHLENGDIQIVRAQSKTQNECCLYEMPQYVTCDHAIGIQWDGFITNPSAWTDEFLEYDYIAPPWPLTNIVNPEWRVGSGGFMLFSKRMAQLWGSLCAPHPEPNDWQMGAIQRASFEKRGIRYAPIEVAMRWGKELDLEDREFPEGESFGFHSFRSNEEYRKKYYEMVYGKS